KQAYQLTGRGRPSLQEWLAEPEAEPQELRRALFDKLLLIRRLANGNLKGLLLPQPHIPPSPRPPATPTLRCLGLRRDLPEQLPRRHTGCVFHTYWCTWGRETGLSQW